MKIIRQAYYLLLAIVFVLFVYTVSLPVDNVLKLLFAVVELLSASYILQHLFNFQQQYGMLLIRTKKGVRFVDVVAKKWKKYWKYAVEFGLVAGFGLIYGYFVTKNKRRYAIYSLITLVFFVLMGYSLLPSVRALKFLVIGSGAVGGLFGFGLFFILFQAFKILTIPNTPAGIQPVIPGTAGFPFFETIIAIIIIAVTHELAHAVIARTWKIKLKSFGALLFGFIPVGAFTEPDEKQLEKSNIQARREVLVAGSTANLIFFPIFILLMLPLAFLASSMVNGVQIQNVVANSSASNVLHEGELIVSVNGIQINNTKDLSYILKNKKEGDELLVKTDEGIKKIILGKGGKIGIFVKEVVLPSNKFFFAILSFVGRIFFLSAQLSFALAVINLLPLFITDGHRIIFEELREKFGIKRAAKYSAIIGIITLAILALNALPYFT